MVAALLIGWLGLSLWGVVLLWRAGKRLQRIPAVGSQASLPTSRVRPCWLSDWGGWVVASSVASLIPAVVPDAAVVWHALLLVATSLALVRLCHALDTLALGNGVVAGLGLLALVLDSLSGGVWAREGVLGHEGSSQGVGELYGALALLWCLFVCHAWLRIEGNPLGVAYLTGLVALWLGWKGQTPALGWGSAVSALTLSLLVLQRELTERRRVRLALQNQPMRVVRLSKGADLAVHGGLLLAMSAGALWLSGIPRVQAHLPNLQELLFALLVVVCGAGILRARALRGGVPMPPALQYAWLSGTIATAALATQPLSIVALGMLLYWAQIGSAHWQESQRRVPNFPLRGGGDK
ncbi:MAG: hypothetical protein NZ550_04910 [Fimbriimonadales bacterium]|nr:hypothetical protein [Fimbriimonadales bacterium]MDW8052272.1 hypothetical protein [Armatimonadota bacterium]